MAERKQLSPEQDIKPLMDEIDRLLAAEQGAGAPPPDMMMAMPPEMSAGPGMPKPEEVVIGAEVEEVEDAPAEAPEEAPAEGDDMAALADMLGVESDKAQQLYEASQQIGRLEGLSPAEVGQMMLDDFQLRMQVEKVAGETMDSMDDMDVETETEIEEVEESPAE